MPSKVVMFFSIIWSFSLFAKDTLLIFYRPFLEGNQILIKKTVQGECWQQSQRIKREDAWRCTAEAKVYDPCFIKPYGPQQEAVCLDSPWSQEAVLIHLPSLADNRHHLSLDMSKAYPWAVELSTGEKCQAIDEGQSFDGLEVRYQCINHSVLIGHLARCEATWSILEQKGGAVSTAFLEKAWF